MIEQRSICLLPFPYTNSSSIKERPVLIISNNIYNSKTEDVVVMALTSNLGVKDYSVNVSSADMESGELKKR